MARFITPSFAQVRHPGAKLICRETLPVTSLKSRWPACQPHRRLLWVVVLDSNMSFQEFMIAALAAIA
jgi:hypothetical protein